MKWIFFVLICLPASLIAQQVGTVKPPSSVSNSNTDISALNSQIAAITNQIKDLSGTINQLRNEIAHLGAIRNNLRGQVASKEKTLVGLDKNAESYATEKGRLEKEIADLNKKIAEVDNQIAAQQSSIDKQTKDLENLQSLLDQQKKKVDELESRNQQKESQKGATDSIENGQAEAYAHVRIINDSLPTAFNGLSLSEKTVIAGFATRFNNDLAFRSKTLNFIKQANSNNYFSTINKAGPVTERNSRFLIAVREELAILSKN